MRWNMRHLGNWKRLVGLYTVLAVVAFIWFRMLEHHLIARPAAIHNTKLPSLTSENIHRRSPLDYPRKNHTHSKIFGDLASNKEDDLVALLLHGKEVISTKTNNKTTSEKLSACIAEPFLDCHNIGIGALLLTTLEQLAFCEALGSTPTVMWRNCQAVCSADPYVNSWEWYFEPVNHGVESVARKLVCVVSFSDYYQPGMTSVPNWLDASFRSRELPDYDDSVLITSETRHLVHDVIHRYVKPRKNITRVVQELYKKHLFGNHLLGIHVRGTDHYMESKGHKLPSIKMWLTEAKLILDSLPLPSKIFIASDNSEVLLAFLKEFGRHKVFFTKAFRTKSYKNWRHAPHSLAENLNIDPQGYGSEVLIDILLLAQCQNFLHGESSIAALASYFNPDMKSYFLGELSSKENGKVQNQETGSMSSPEADTDAPYDSSDKQSSEYKEEEIVETLDCFAKISPASSCDPNMTKRKFIKLSEVKRFLSGDS